MLEKYNYFGNSELGLLRTIVTFNENKALIEIEKNRRKLIIDIKNGKFVN